MLVGLGAGLGYPLLAVLASAAAWLRPFGATDAALAALRPDAAVDVQEHAGWYAFVPRATPPTAGLVHSPGARVDVRATAAVLRPLAQQGYLVVASVSGSRDGLTTPADVDASRAHLPASTTFTQVDGAVHASFADYGPQPGDGEPGVPRARAQAGIVRASLDLLAAVDHG